MGPPEEWEEGPPEPEPLEQRGPMEGYPSHGAHAPPSLASRLVQGLRAKGHAVIQVYAERLGGGQWTASGLLLRAEAQARGLVALGVAPGGVVCVVGGAHPEYGPLFLATLLAGATFAPLNHRFDDGDLRRLLSLISPSLVLSVAQSERRLRDIVASAVAPRPPPAVIALGEGTAWEDLCTGGHGATLPPPPADARAAVAVIACSSGSTGLPKGVVSTHAALHATLDMFMHPAAEAGLGGTLMFTSPAFWVTGIWYTLLSMVAPALCLVYEFGANEEQFLEAVEKHRPETIFTANNFLLSVAKAHEAALHKRDISSVKVALTGGAPMSPEADAFIQATLSGARLLSVFGMTELNAGIGLTQVPQRKTGSVGKPSPFLRCKVVEEGSGRALGAGAEGELRFKGPTLCSGYLSNLRATAELFDASGWLRSGDLGLYDHDGFFYVTGRIKDTIKYRGVHVSPMELEGLLDAHPSVLESAVVGVPDPIEQELPRAFVVRRPGASVTEEELQALVQGSVAEHKWLRGGVVFLDALPKSSTGKISRAEIRRRFLSTPTQ